MQYDNAAGVAARKEHEELMDRLRFKWASGVAEELLQAPSVEQKLLIDIAIARAIRRKLGNTDFGVLRFWSNNTSAYIRLQVAGSVSAAFASERFEWVLYENHRQIECRADINPLDRFRKLLLRCCPRYREVCSRFPPETILQSNGHNLDLAFLECVHRYSCTVGKITLKERGFVAWPPDNNWVGFCA